MNITYREYHDNSCIMIFLSYCHFKISISPSTIHICIVLGDIHLCIHTYCIVGFLRFLNPANGWCSAFFHEWPSWKLTRDKADKKTEGNTFNLSCNYWHDLSNIRIFHDFKVFLHRLKLREVSSAPETYLWGNVRVS